MVVVGIVNGRGNFSRSLGTLNPYRKQFNLDQRIAFVENPQHIMDRRTGGAGDNSNGAGIPGDGLFMVRIKKSLRMELPLQLLKGSVEVPHSIGG